MEAISVQSSPRKEVSGLRPFKNPRRRSSRGSSLSRSGGSLALPTTNLTSSWGSSPANPPPPPYYSLSQPPLLPLPRVNSSSTLPLQRVNSSRRPRVNKNYSTLPYAQTKAELVEYVPSLTRTGSVPVRSNQMSDFPRGFDGYPGPAIMLLSPPPSSLPMPRFNIKPKLPCNAEAARKNDVVATDNVRRVLQLR